VGMMTKAKESRRCCLIVGCNKNLPVQPTLPQTTIPSRLRKNSGLKETDAPQTTRLSPRRSSVRGWRPTVEGPAVGQDVRGGTVSAHVAASTRLRIRTRLYTAAAKVHSQPTRCTPRSLTLHNTPTVFNHPKISSTRLRFW